MSAFLASIGLPEIVAAHHGARAQRVRADGWGGLRRRTCGTCSRADRGATQQRALIADSIAPIWEANHVWLIVVVVVLFTAFPVAFGTLGIGPAHSDRADAHRHRAARVGVRVPKLRQPRPRDGAGGGA